MRRILLVSLTGILLAGVLIATRGADANPPPALNFVVFLTDDQRFDSLWAMPIVQDRLVSRGVNFTNAIVTTPLCCPFRASFLGGGHLSQNTRVYQNHAPQGGFLGFYDLNSLPLTLQGAGYATSLVGKYLNDYPDPLGPYIPPGWSNFQGWSGGPAPTVNEVIEGSSTTTSSTGMQLVENGRFREDWWRDLTLQFLADTPGATRFVYHSAFSPHFPADVAVGDENLFPGYVYRERGYGEVDMSDKPGVTTGNAEPYDSSRFNSIAEQDEFHRDQLRSLQSVDRAIGAIYDQIELDGELGNTVFIFTSDNGYMWGEHGQWGKGQPYDEAIRVPLVVVMPGVAARDDASLVTVDLDVPATLLDLAGLPVTGNGLSLVPLLQNPAAPWREELLIEQVWEFVGIKTRSLIDGQEWKYIWRARGLNQEELYDLTADPFELESLHADPAHQLKKDELQALVFAQAGTQIDNKLRIPNGKLGVPYSKQIGFLGGTPPYDWKILSGALPDGLSLDPLTGIVSGTPTEIVVNKVVQLEISSSTIATQLGLPQAHFLGGMKLTITAGTTACSDGLDNDGDTLIDYPADPGCISFADPQEFQAGTAACDDGIDNDGDLLIDMLDPDCTDAFDTEEAAGPTSPCNDGIDNDGDLLIDHPDDPGCRTPDWPLENPHCNDGIDNDQDGGIDYDGTPEDLQCAGVAWRRSEKPSCGLGAELAVVLALMLGVRSAKSRFSN